MPQKTQKDLEPPDLKRCQGEHKSGSFLTLGPRTYVRCKKEPTYIAFEKHLGKDGLQGSMALCDECAEVMQKLMPGTATLCRIKEIRV